MCASTITSAPAGSRTTCGGFHQVAVARSTVHRLLGKDGLGRLPANQKQQAHRRRWQRYEKPQPGHRLQVDVKFLERIPGSRKRLYQFTAIDDCTRIRVLKVFDACNQVTAIRFIDFVLRRLPFRVHVLQTDNGAEFQSRFHWHLTSRDVRHVYIRPRTPHLNGKVEPSHRVDDQECYQLLDDGTITDDINLFKPKRLATHRQWHIRYGGYFGKRLSARLRVSQPSESKQRVATCMTPREPPQLQRSDGVMATRMASPVRALVALCFGARHRRRATDSAGGVRRSAGWQRYRVPPKPGDTLRFYRPPALGEAPGDYPPSDIVRFGPGLPSVDIAEAPPWLVPEHLKMDYELFHLRALTLSQQWVEVIGNSTTAETRWVERARRWSS